MTFESKTVWITGASSGIGEALAKAFAAKGAKIILSGRRVDALQQVADSLSTESMILPFETTDFENLAARVEEAWAWNGRVDILVNNAGVSQRSLAVNTDPQVYTDLLNIDLIAPIWLTQLNLPRMVEAGGAHIVAISSVAGRIGVALRTAYCAAKHGLIGYMDALRSEEIVRNNINVTNVLPGSIKTDVSRNAMTDDGSRRGKSDEVIENGMTPALCAEQILDAISQNMPEIIIAEGPEKQFAEMRHTDPEQLFQITAQLGETVAKRYDAGDDG